MKPIIFTTEMTKAILAGRKSMTRRVVKCKKNIIGKQVGFTAFTPSGYFSVRGNHDDGKTVTYGESFFKLPYQVGDILYVRETWATQRPAMGPGEEIPDYTNYIYKADNPEPYWGNGKWKSPRFMPKAAARIFLKVTDVRVERLQDITEEDAIAEGVRNDRDNLYHPIEYSVIAYRILWESIYGKGSWDLNPWVWVIIFTRIDKPNN